jgi:hypothetical protein
VVILFVFSISHTSEKSDILPKGDQMATWPIAEVIKDYVRILMSIPGVVGMGQAL